MEPTPDGEIQMLGMTPAEARHHIGGLEEERALALESGMAEIDAYMEDLDTELEVWRRLYVVAAVTEIASLRAELAGTNDG
jgi:hypothetical protein